MNDLLSEKQKQFLFEPLHRINLLYGSVRSGKTFGSLVKWPLWIASFPQDKEFLMAGKTITTLKRNCLKPLEKIIGEKNISFSTSQKVAHIFGRTVWLEGANDERSEDKIRGSTLQGVYIDELTEIPEGFYMMALSRLSEAGAAMIATTNPDAPNHYVKTQILDNKEIDLRSWKFLLDDNPFLDEEYKRQIKKEYTGVYYQRFILGDFVRAEGVVFRDFADDPDSYSIIKSNLPRFRSVGVGYDLGGNASDYSLVATGITFDNRVIVLRVREIEAQQMRLSDVEETAKKFIESVENDFGVTIRSGYVDDNYYTAVNSLNDWRPLFDSAARVKGVMPLADRPLLLSKMMASGRFQYVSGECDDLVEQLQNAVYDDRADRAIILDDGSMNIDAIDAFFYSIADDYLILGGER